MTVDIERARVLAQELVDVVTDEDQQSAAPADEVTLTGTIGRPELKTVKGTPLFTAGLAIRCIDGKLEWVSIEAWRAIATELSAYSRGQTVTVAGRWKTNQWVDQDGVMRSRDVFVVRRVSDPDASSAITP